MRKIERAKPALRQTDLEEYLEEERLREAERQRVLGSKKKESDSGDNN